MIKADYKDKKLVVDILTLSFAANQSVNYIIKQGNNQLERIQYLMEYSFEVCYLFGDIFLTEDRNACALILYPDKKKTTFTSIILDAKLIFFGIGLMNIKKTLSREALIKEIHPKEPMYYLWFIGVHPKYQNKGMGTKLLKEILRDSYLKKRTIYLETSTLKNLPWYQKLGFHIYYELDLGYTLFFLKRYFSEK
ncbi:N-acetyltransferase [Adhaeribacter arboris]|uniref:N-acetyltransferase n=1 Tax=Adhaeribacter arboris TaxID=2072846 RepID=A0A2T2YPL3_9BACT|nr:GNAT family N-acetyltransferase [Adhaeribacter arboris]PSR57428.1 N-acetyltransferase [Adhaeribacter arboris]